MPCAFALLLCGSIRECKHVRSSGAIALAASLSPACGTWRCNLIYRCLSLRSFLGGAQEAWQYHRRGLFFRCCLGPPFPSLGPVSSSMCMCEGYV